MLKKDDYILLCEKGDQLYRVTSAGVIPIIIKEILDYSTHYVYKDDLGNTYFNHTLTKTCFKTQEEAEQEIVRRNNISKKRQLLKEYERTLNEKFNLNNHFIVK